MTKKELLWQTLHTVDVGQTLTIARHPEQYREIGLLTSALIGEHPSERSVWLWGALLSVGHFYTQQWLDANHPTTGTVFYTLTTLDVANSVQHNHEIGIRADF